MHDAPDGFMSLRLTARGHCGISEDMTKKNAN